MPVELSARQQQHWEEYMLLENSGTRADRLRALDAFIEELLRTPNELWKRWAIELAARVVDEAVDLPVRHPLFERVLFPALVEGMEEKSAGCARWLAGFEQQLYRCSKCIERLGWARSTGKALLLEAVAQDPGDRRAGRRLIQVIAREFDSSLHELPAGVLYGMDGATPSQCDELIAELDEFRTLVAAEGCEAEYAELVAECEYHFKAYKRYRMEMPRRGSYAEFLARGGAVQA